MSTSILGHSCARLFAFVQSFARRREGIAAVEFALIVPLMAAMFIGAVELSEAITANRRAAMVASTIGDIAARNDATIADSTILDTMNVGSFLLYPFKSYDSSYPTNILKVNLSLVGSSATDATKTTLEWSCDYAASNTAAVTCTCPWTSVVIPPNLVTVSDYVIVTTATYGYKPPFFDFFMSASRGGGHTGVYTFTDTVYSKPRANVPQLTIGAAAPCVLK